MSAVWRVAAMLALAGCAPRDGGTPRTTETPMIERLDALVTLLSTDVDADQIRSRLTAAALRGEVALYPEGYAVTGKPYLVELELAAPLAVSALEGAFGALTEGRSDRGRPRVAMFSPPERTGPFSVVVLAKVEGPGELRAASTTRVTLRRDPKS
jgi:hypothetical protein